MGYITMVGLYNSYNLSLRFIYICMYIYIYMMGESNPRFILNIPIVNGPNGMWKFPTKHHGF